MTRGCRLSRLLNPPRNPERSKFIVYTLYIRTCLIGQAHIPVMSQNAWIVDCVRTPAGKNKGSLSKYHPADLGAVVRSSFALVARPDFRPTMGT